MMYSSFIGEIPPGLRIGQGLGNRLTRYWVDREVLGETRLKVTVVGKKFGDHRAVGSPGTGDSKLAVAGGQGPLVLSSYPHCGRAGRGCRGDLNANIVHPGRDVFLFRCALHSWAAASRFVNKSTVSGSASRNVVKV